MQKIVVHDSRLQGDTPQDNDITPIRVGPTTPIREMIQQVRNAAIRYGNDVKLNILCHGYEERGELGYGLQLCREDLTLQTVDQLRDLAGQLSYGIDIYSCGAANTASWQVGQRGDGWMLCSRIARTTQSVLRAAVLTQMYNYSNGFMGLFRQAINFGRWEGRVITFDSRGNEIASEMNPAR